MMADEHTPDIGELVMSLRNAYSNEWNEEAARALTMLEARCATLRAERDAIMAVLDREHEWYSEKDGALDGIPFEHVAHVIRVMIKRAEAALANASTKFGIDRLP